MGSTAVGDWSTKEQESAMAFNQWASTYDEDCSKEVELFAAVTHHEVLASLLDMAKVQPGDVVLDVGTGTGWAAIRSVLAQKEIAVHGLDMTSAMLTQVRDNEASVGLSQTVSLTRGSGMRLPISDNQFDLVMSSLALHHMMVPETIREMVRVLRPGGRLAIADMGIPQAWRSPPMSWLLRLMVAVYGLSSSPQARREADSFNHVHTPREWRHHLEEQGLRNVSVSQSQRSGAWMLPTVIYSYGEKEVGVSRVGKEFVANDS